MISSPLSKKAETSFMPFSMVCTSKLTINLVTSCTRLATYTGGSLKYVSEGLQIVFFFVCAVCIKCILLKDKSYIS